MDKQTVIENAVSEVLAAAREVLTHGDSAGRPDPIVALLALGFALEAGATHEEIVAEMQRQRGA